MVHYHMISLLQAEPGVLELPRELTHFWSPQPAGLHPLHQHMFRSFCLSYLLSVHDTVRAFLCDRDGAVGNTESPRETINRQMHTAGPETRIPRGKSDPRKSPAG